MVESRVGTENKRTGVLIIGGGPAGLTTAIYYNALAKVFMIH